MHLSNHIAKLHGNPLTAATKLYSMYNYYSDNVEKLVSLPADAEAH